MTEIPLEVADAETIVRGICSPFHVKKGKLQWNAFLPPPGSDEVSIIRHDYVGVKFCKAKAKELTDPQKTYEGMAFINVGVVRACDAEVIDSRVVYLGHGDIKHQRSNPPRNEPREGPDLEFVRSVCKSIQKKAAYVADPDVASEEWSPALPPILTA